MTQAAKNCLEVTKSQIKLMVRDLERECGIYPTAPVNMLLLHALARIERMERHERAAIAAAEREARGRG
jgi:hypothetical protein